MVNYQNGKIYVIYNKLTGKIVYIGSTCRLLCKRMNDHNCHYKIETKNSKLYKLMREFGHENFYIELLENFPCNSKEELLAREGHHQRLHKDEIVNQQIANNYLNEENRANYERERGQLEHRKEYRKEYEKNRPNKEERVIEGRKRYAIRNEKKITCECGSEFVPDLLNKHLLTDKHKEYLKENGKEEEIIDKVRNRTKEKTKYECECGSKITNGEKSRHDKTKKHLDFLKLKSGEIDLTGKKACECGAVLNINTKDYKHNKTKKHLDYLKNKNET
jgi:hypothetical protein